jgi:hypothetical protein
VLGIIRPRTRSFVDIAAGWNTRAEAGQFLLWESTA